MMQRVLGQLRASGANPNLTLLGVLMTMFDVRTRLSQQVVSEVREHFKETVFDTVIPRSTRLAEAPSFGKPILDYDPYNAGAAAYEVLAQEVLGRLRLSEARPQTNEARSQTGCTGSSVDQRPATPR